MRPLIPLSEIPYYIVSYAMIRQETIDTNSACRPLFIYLTVLNIHVVSIGSALLNTVICFYLSNEGVSLLENASHLGLPVPEKLKAVLSQLHNKDDNEK